MDLKISSIGETLLVKWEGCKNEAYKCPRGFWTIAIGHKIILPQEDYLLSEKLNGAEIDEIFYKDAAPREAWLNINCADWEIPIKQNEFDALMSFTWQYYIEDPDYINTKNAIIAGNRQEIVGHLMLFINSIAGNGDHMMLDRRISEVGLFQKPID